MEKQGHRSPAFAPWISLGNVLTIIVMATGGLGVLSVMNQATAVQAEKIRAADENIKRIESDVKVDLSELRSEMKELRADVRKLLERK